MGWEDAIINPIKGAIGAAEDFIGGNNPPPTSDPNAEFKTHQQIADDIGAGIGAVGGFIGNGVRDIINTGADTPSQKEYRQENTRAISDRMEGTSDWVAGLAGAAVGLGGEIARQYNQRGGTPNGAEFAIDENGNTIRASPSKEDTVIDKPSYKDNPNAFEATYTEDKYSRQSGYTADVADLGLDRKTWSLIAAGDSPLEAVTKRLDEETNPTLRRELEWQQGQLLQTKIEASSAQHHAKKDSTNPADWTPNTLENVGDMALAIKEGGTVNRKSQLNLSNPGIDVVMDKLPGKDKGWGDIGWDYAKTDFKKDMPSLLPAITIMENARKSGDVGIYGTLGTQVAPSTIPSRDYTPAYTYNKRVGKASSDPLDDSWNNSPIRRVGAESEPLPERNFQYKYNPKTDYSGVSRYFDSKEKKDVEWSNSIAQDLGIVPKATSKNTQSTARSSALNAYTDTPFTSKGMGLKGLTGSIPAKKDQYPKEKVNQGRALAAATGKNYIEDISFFGKKKSPKKPVHPADKQMNDILYGNHATKPQKLTRAIKPKRAIVDDKLMNEILHGTTKKSKTPATKKQSGKKIDYRNWGI